MTEQTSRSEILAAHAFKPGQSGNPGGRPKKLPITDYLKEQLAAPIPESMRAKLPPVFVEVYGPDASFGQMLAFKLIQQAARGDMQAASMILERTEGRVTQKIAGEGNGPIEFILTRVDQQTK